MSGDQGEPPVGESELTTLRPVYTLDPGQSLPAPAFLRPPTYGDVLDDRLRLEVPPRFDDPVPEDKIWRPPVPKVWTEASRRSRIAMVAVVLAVCAALPWVVPQIPDLFVDAAEKATQAETPDPDIEPLTPESSAKPVESLEGIRLKSSGEPVEVTVKRLKVRSRVIPISGESGELVPPDDPQVLGWWQEGARAGTAQGSVVVTGHTVSTGGGALDHLGKLEPGDRIGVRTTAGAITYVVREVRDLPVEELARTSAAIFDQQIEGRLVLITCSDFDGRVYRSNSVVYATPIEDDPRR